MTARNANKETILILHNIRSTYNVGAIFRTADAAGVSKIFLTGYTPTPVDEFGRKRNDIAKTALGAEDAVSWEYKKSIGPLIQNLKKGGVQVVAIEQSPNSIDYKKFTPKTPVAFIVGSEVEGLSKQVLNKADAICEIPMKGKKESLNVSVALGVVLFRVLNV